MVVGCGGSGNLLCDEQRMTGWVNCEISQLMGVNAVGNGIAVVLMEVGVLKNITDNDRVVRSII